MARPRKARTLYEKNCRLTKEILKAKADKAYLLMQNKKLKGKLKDAEKGLQIASVIQIGTGGVQTPLPILKAYHTLEGVRIEVRAPATSSTKKGLEIV